MKRVAFFMFCFVVAFIAEPGAGLAQYSPKDPGSYDYWLEKMQDPNQDFYQLVEEFDHFWKGKEGPKGSGYKQFKRWQYNWQGEVGENGRIHSAEYIRGELQKFEMMASDAVVGDWDFVGYSSNPIPEAAGHGRLACIAFHPTNANIIYVGAPAGGLWKSTTGGNNWSVCGTDQLPTLGVNSIAVDPSNPNIIYIGTGDKDAWDAPGMGVYKTTDGGTNWTEMNYGMGDVTVTKLLISSDSPDTLIAATTSGVFKTNNGGLSWQQSPGIYGYVNDMCFKPGTFQVVYACVDGRFFRSDNYGNTWDDKFVSLQAHRSVIGVSPANSSKVHFFCTKDGKAYKHYISNDGGLTFPTTMTPDFESGQGGYNLDIAVDPTNANIIYVGMVGFFKTSNGGSSWTNIGSSPLHADQHALEWSPHNGRLYIGNDGGIYYTANGGSSYTDINQGLAIAMTARLFTSHQNSDILVCGQQDCGTFVTSGSTFYHVNGGDGMDCQVDPANSNIIYVSSQHGPIKRTTEGHGQGASYYNIAGKKGINGITDTIGAWLMPFHLHEDNPAIMYACFSNVWKSANVNTSNPSNVSWTRISNFNDTKVTEYISKSPVDDNIIWIGRAKPWSLHLTTNANSASPTWTQITMPYSGSIQWIETHPEQPNTCYICIKHRIYKTTDLGNIWTRIDGDMPGVTKNCIVYQHGSNENLYVATRLGVYYRDADMPPNTWLRFKTGIPMNVPVAHLEINYGTNPPTLFAGTWGRGIWKTDAQPLLRPNLYLTDGTSSVDKTKVYLGLIVRNADQDVTSDPCTLGYYLSANSIIGPSDYLIGTDEIPGLNPGAYSVQSLWADVEYGPNPPPPGTYYIGAYIDKDNIVTETNETDNAILFTHTVTINTLGVAQNVTATDGDYGNKIMIDWDPWPNAQDTVYYMVHRNTNNNYAGSQPIGTVWSTTTESTDTTAGDGIDYWYWVRGSYNYLGVNPGPYSSHDIGWQYLDPPSNVNATQGVYDDKIRISWQAAPGATHYRVYKSAYPSYGSAVPLTTNWHTAKYIYDYAVSSGHTYYYWVKSAKSSTGLKSSPYFSAMATGSVALMDAPTATASDGIYTNKISISWNTIPGANYYRLHYSYTDDPATAAPLTPWATLTSIDYQSATPGIYIYFWVQAAVDAGGTLATGLGEGDAGWRKLETVQNVNASDGASSDFIQVTWNNQPNADYYRVYRNLINANFANSVPITPWIGSASHNDLTAPPPQDCFYWVLCAKDTAITSDQSSYNAGWRKLQTPIVEATDGHYANKVAVTWDAVPGAGSYRVFRGPASGIYITDTLTEWSSTLGFQFSDFTAVLGQSYRYHVMAAYNNYGYRPGDNGYDIGFAGECPNLKEHPDPAYRAIDITGTELTIYQRIVNDGPFASSNGVDVTYFLTSGPPLWSGQIFLGTIFIPPIPSGGYYNVNYQVDLASLSVNHGTYYIQCLINYGGYGFCETNFLDNDIRWENPSVNYTDALFGTYTIGGTNPDYSSVAFAATDLFLRGMSATVTFNIRPGFYNEQVYLPAITGSNSSRPVIFQTEPGHSDTAEISFAGYEENFTFMFDGASNFTLKNLKITSPGYTNYQGTYGRVIDIRNNVSNITVENCLLKGSSDLTNVTDEIAVIYCGNSPSAFIFIRNNTILNGSWGIYLAGAGLGNNTIENIIIDNNEIRDFSCSGVFLRYPASPIVKQNKIIYHTTAVAQCFGINIEASENGLRIERNQVIMEPSQNVAYGILLTSCNTGSSSRGKIANNFISIISDGKPAYGLMHFISEKTDVYYNSINISGSPYSESIAVAFDCDQDIAANPDNMVVNNIFANEAGGYAFGMGDNAVSKNYISSSDYNDLYSNGAFLGYYGYTNKLTDLATWRAATPFDDHSVSADPEFTSATDLHTSSANVGEKASPISQVYDDIDGDGRDWLLPDIGADEHYTPPPDMDVALTEILSPSSGYGLTNQETVEVEITNFGSTGFGSLTVGYSVNGGISVIETCTDTIPPWGETVNFAFTTKADLSAGGTYEIKAFTMLPGDERPSNDTLAVLVTNEPINPYNCVPLYGEGCINGANINDFYFGNLSHELTGCSANSYGDFTGMTATVEQGESVWVGLSSEAEYMYAAIWIDFNNDLIFSEQEKVKDTLNCGWYGVSWDTLNIPAGTMPGQYRMRVRAVQNENMIYPCNYYESGEAHDYTLAVETGGGLAVYACEDVSVCSGIPAVLSAYAAGGTAPYTYLWSNGMTGPSITINVDTTTVFTVQSKDQSGYIAVDEVTVFISDPPESLSSTNSPVCEGADILLQGDGVAFGVITTECQNNCSLPSNYCDSYALDMMGTSINAVYFNTIQNNPDDSCTMYSNFTSIQTTVVKGQDYNLSVRSGGCYGNQYHIVSAFIDWNRDADFDDTGEMVAYFDPVFSTTTQETFVQVPMNAVLGKTMMRVVTVGDWGMAVDTVLPCGTYWNGETEDYTVNIIGTEPNQIASWHWSGPAGFSSFLQNPVISSATPAMDGYYSLEVEDSKGCIGTDSVFVGIQHQPYSFAGGDTTLCEGGYLTLHGQAENYDTIMWSTSGMGFFDDRFSLSTRYYPGQYDILNGSVELTLTAYAVPPCTDSLNSSLLLSIQGMPYVEVTLSDATCGTGGYQVTGTIAQNYSELRWASSGTGTYSDTTALNPVYYPSPGDLQTGTLDLTVTAYSMAPCVSESFGITELWIQQTVEVFAGSDTTICSNESLVLSDAAALNYASLLWSTSGTGYFSNPTALNPEYFPGSLDIQNGSVIISLTGTSISPCVADSVSSIILGFVEEPYVFAGGPGFICEGDSYYLFDSDAANYSSLHWETSGNGYFDDPGILHPTYYPGLNDTGHVIIGFWAFGNGPCMEAYSNLLLDIQPSAGAFAGDDATVQQGSNYFISDATASNYSNLEWTTSGNGFFDNPYSLNPIYYPDPPETGTTILTLTAYGFSPCGDTVDQMKLEIVSPGFSLDIKIFLEGPYYGPDMMTTVNTGGFLPLAQPYNTSPWNYFGAEAVAAIPNADVVDWILVELRDAPDASSAISSTVIAQQAAFLLKNGSVVSTDGQSWMQFSNLTVQQSLFAVVWHRNSIGIMSANPLIETSGVYSYDFTSGAGQAYGGMNAHKELAPGVWGMAGADGNADGQVNNGDKIDVWVVEAGTSGYKSGDFNLDSQVNNGDKNDIWIPNTGTGGQVPDMVKSCYVPE